MTSSQIDAITGSWDQVSQDPDLIPKFYEKLFEIAPQTKSYFPDDMTKQSEKLAYTLGFVVGNLDRLEDIRESVEDLGRSHRKLKIKDEEYAFVKEALLTTIDNSLEGDSTAIIEAWDVAISYIANLMINAPEKRQPRIRPLFKRLFG